MRENFPLLKKNESSLSWILTSAKSICDRTSIASAVLFVNQLLASLKTMQEKEWDKACQGKITYEEAGKRAAKMGEAAGRRVFEYLGKLYPAGIVEKDDALNVIQPSLKSAYEYSARLTELAQKEVNREAGAGLKPLIPEYNKKSAIALAEFLENQENFLDYENSFVLEAERDIRSYIDNAVRMNAEAQERLGLETYVTRIYDDVGLHDGKDPCPWCLERAGQWTYQEAIDAGVFARHPGCGCVIVYSPQKGKATVRVGGGGWTNVSNHDTLNARKKYGLEIGNPRFKTGNMTPENYARAVEFWNRLDEFPGLSAKEKEWVYEMFDNNLTAEEKSSPIVNRPFGNFHYFAVNRGHNQYKIYDKKSISGTDWMDEIMSEVIGADWRRYDF